MAIFKGSRYEFVPVYHHYNGVDGDDKDKKIDPTKGTMIPTLRRRDLTEFHTKEAIVHVFQRGDRIDLLAYKYYGDAQKWWVIMDANTRYMTPWDIPVGANLIIPPIDSFMGGEY